MFTQMRSLWERRPSWTPEALAILGGLYYAWQTWGYAHSQRSRLDEGLYMVKGLYFAIGRYWPFQDYGPLTNHMPLSFVIPGYIQAWFGPGVRTGRYFAVLLSILTLVAVWLAARRLAGRWWAAAAVGAMALNTFIVKTYSIGLSQVLVAVLLAWSLALVVGEKPQDLGIIGLCIPRWLAVYDTSQPCARAAFPGALHLVELRLAQGCMECFGWRECCAGTSLHLLAGYLADVVNMGT